MPFVLVKIFGTPPSALSLWKINWSILQKLVQFFRTSIFVLWVKALNLDCQEVSWPKCQQKLRRGNFLIPSQQPFLSEICVGRKLRDEQKKPTRVRQRLETELNKDWLFSGRYYFDGGVVVMTHLFLILSDQKSFVQLCLWDLNTTFLRSGKHFMSKGSSIITTTQYQLFFVFCSTIYLSPYQKYSIYCCHLLVKERVLARLKNQLEKSGSNYARKQTWKTRKIEWLEKTPILKLDFLLNSTLNFFLSSNSKKKSNLKNLWTWTFVPNKTWTRIFFFISRVQGSGMISLYFQFFFIIEKRSF